MDKFNRRLNKAEEKINKLEDSRKKLSRVKHGEKQIGKCRGEG